MTSKTWFIVLAVLVGLFVVLPALIWTIWLLRIVIMVAFLLAAAFYLGRVTKRK